MSSKITLSTNTQSALNSSQKIQKTKRIGGKGGSSYNYMFGNKITQISASNFLSLGINYVGGLSVSFDDGKTINLGTTNSTPRVLDLSQDTISQMYIKTIKNDSFFTDSGCGVIYIETIKGQKWDSINGADSTLVPDNTFDLVSDEDGEPVQNFYPVGIFGYAGGAIDALGFYFKKDALICRSMENFSYSDLKKDGESPINLASATVSNQTGISQISTIQLSKSVSSTYKWSTEAGLTAGITTTFTTKIPFVAEASVELSLEMSFAYTFGEEATITDDFSYTANIEVPPGSSVQVDAIAFSSQVTGTYTATLIENWENAGEVVSQVSGQISGVNAYNVHVDYTNYTNTQKVFIGRRAADLLPLN